MDTGLTVVVLSLAKILPKWIDQLVHGRHVAKNVVAAGLAERCLLQVAYAIGFPEPVSLMVNTYGTGKVPDDKIVEIVSKLFSFQAGGNHTVFGSAATHLS